MNNSKEKLLNYLVPPGQGVFTVNTAKEKKESLYTKMYNKKQDIDHIWKKSLNNLDLYQGAALLGICSDTGGGIQRGANWGPLMLRNTILENTHSSYFDLGDIKVIPHLLHDKYLNLETIKNCRKALYKDSNSKLPVSPLSIAEEFCHQFYTQYNNKGIFAIGGDHSVSYPLTKSWIQKKKKDNKKVALIHFDAHTDLLQERLGIDLCFGSWLSHVLPFLDSPKHCYQIGIRSSGLSKEYWQNKFNINQYWAKDVQDLGPYDLVQKIVHELKLLRIEELYISFDIDCLDESVASATGTPEGNGLFPHECMIILKNLQQNFKITGADLVEIAPFIGNNKIGSINTLEAGASLANFLIESINKAYANIVYQQEQ